LIKLFSGIVFTGSIPKISDERYEQIGGQKKIQYPKIDASSYANIAIAQIIFKSRSTHGTLREGCTRQNDD